MATKRAVISGRISGRTRIVVRSAHATASDTAHGEWTVTDALDAAARKLIEHSANERGEYDFDRAGRLND